MSAAKKLKALEREQALEGRFPTWKGDEALLAALPQIVAVVKAAEEFALRVDEEQQNERTYRLDDALAALEESLS